MSDRERLARHCNMIGERLLLASNVLAYVSERLSSNEPMNPTDAAWLLAFVNRSLVRVARTAAVHIPGRVQRIIAPAREAGRTENGEMFSAEWSMFPRLFLD